MARRLDEQLKEVFNLIQTRCYQAQTEYLDGNLMEAMIADQRIEMLETVVTDLNEKFGTKYELKPTEKYQKYEKWNNKVQEEVYGNRRNKA